MTEDQYIHWRNPTAVRHRCAQRCDSENEHSTDSDINVNIAVTALLVVTAVTLMCTVVLQCCHYHRCCTVVSLHR